MYVCIYIYIYIYIYTDLDLEAQSACLTACNAWMGESTRFSHKHKRSDKHKNADKGQNRDKGTRLDKDTHNSVVGEQQPMYVFIHTNICMYIHMYVVVGELAVIR